MAHDTERELLEKLEYYTIEIENRLLKEDDYYSVLNDIPFPVHLAHPKTFQLLYVNRKHNQLTGYTEEQVREKWDEYIQIVHPDTVESLLKYLPDFYKRKGRNETISFLQHAKLFGGDEYQPLITFSKVSRLPGDLKLWIYTEPEVIEKDTQSLEQVIRMDEFKLKHFRRFQRLTGREIQILTLLAEGLNNPKIADRLYLSRSTIETHRKNLKKKLELKSYRDVIRYALAFDLIKF
ncbi:LuxR C-terminal-related transcriptional regulator [Gracilimonas sp.]|uniref:LuxR C-terminal-related transcriptional regulator n=1 Tax=Gracilimonas sp. TaxID=1974203 RepID=UPI003BA8CE61